MKKGLKQIVSILLCCVILLVLLIGMGITFVLGKKKEE